MVFGAGGCTEAGTFRGCGGGWRRWRRRRRGWDGEMAGWGIQQHCIWAAAAAARTTRRRQAHDRRTYDTTSTRQDDPVRCVRWGAQPQRPQQPDDGPRGRHQTKGGTSTRSTPPKRPAAGPTMGRASVPREPEGGGVPPASPPRGERDDGRHDDADDGDDGDDERADRRDDERQRRRLRRRRRRRSDTGDGDDGGD